MDFEEAVTLAEDISNHLGWSAELDTNGEIDRDTYVYLVTARFERYGLVYNAEIEVPHQWPHHLLLMDAWTAKKEKQLHD